MPIAGWRGARPCAAQIIQNRSTRGSRGGDGQPARPPRPASAPHWCRPLHSGPRLRSASWLLDRSRQPRGSWPAHGHAHSADRPPSPVCEPASSGGALVRWDLIRAARRRSSCWPRAAPKGAMVCSFPRFLMSRIAMPDVWRICATSMPPLCQICA